MDILSLSYVTIAKRREDNLTTTFDRGQASTGMIRKYVDTFAAMKALNNYIALDVHHTQTVKDEMTSDAGM